ncbi:MAG: hypothetical protein ACP5N2_06365 [Candidatus Nanoarchaeia archaeon]
MQKGVKVVLVLFILLFSIFQAVFLMYESAHPNDKIQTLAVQGTVSICINQPPVLISGCEELINQSTSQINNTYACQINATKIIFDANYSLNYSYVSFTMPGVYFNLNSSGFVTIDANETGVGTYLIPISIKDTSPCPMPLVYDYQFSILNLNDPPILTRLLPSKDINEGDFIMPFFLDDYFMDPDGDEITYSVSNSVFSIFIDNVTSRVTITAPTGFCEEEDVYFIATDEHNLSTESNPVSLEEICTEEQTGGGGGGGGGRTFCEPEWSCRDWSKCFINSTQFRTCIDLNGCDLDELKKDFWKECTYVPTCYDGVQNQGETGIDCGGPCAACMLKEEPPKPKEPSCNDGIKNQGETGIDCGGPCLVCKQIEVPGLIPDDKGNDILTMLMIILFSAGAIALIYAIFRKEVKTLFAKIAWWMTRRKKKQILLEDNEREELMDLLRVLDEKTRKAGSSIKPTDKLFQETMRVNRLYLNYALKSHSFYEDELEKALKRVLNNDLARALKMFVKRQTVLETSNQTISRENLLYYVQELRQLVLNTSRYDRKDYSFVAKEISLTGTPVERCNALLYNATVALEFMQVDNAKDYYYELLKTYEVLNEKEKGMVFYEISKVFNYIRYVLSWAEK